MERKIWRIREPFSGISHFVGAVLSVVGLITLLVLARGRPLPTLGVALYGASLILLYTSSSLYHSLHVSERIGKVLQRLDHTAIYLLIAGTYAPLCLTALHGALGWSLLAAVYTIALAGICVVFFWQKAPHWVRVGLYVIMGWLSLLAIPRLIRVLPHAAVIWLVAGGVVYTVGMVVYATNRPNLWPGKFSAHDLWHVFVLGGSICHFVPMIYAITLL